MRTFLAYLPKNTGASFVLVQHLSPDSKSIMGELLSRETDMPVRVVYEDTPVQANHIYVMSESKDLIFSNGMLITQDRNGSNHLHLPIDQFFNSLASNLGPKAMGIILSGTGTDGTRGVRAIKEQGGIVLVQDQKSATFNGMPQSAISLNIADAVLPPDKLAESVVNLLNGRAATEGHQTLVDPQEQRSEIQDVITYLTEQSGVNFHGYRKPTLIRRMENRMLLQNCNTVKDYLQLLETNPAEVQALFHNVLIGVTRFFRDAPAFEDLRNNILPKIFAGPRHDDEPYRFWIPACSTGEEAYSIAMIVDEYVRKNDLDADYKIFASDVDEDAIKFAIKGRYTASMVADTPKNLMVQYFDTEGAEYVVKPYLRKKVLFAVQDLIGDPPFINMDLISCRNLLIYLEPETQQTILSTLHFALRDNGVLMLGPSESLGALKYAYRQLTRQWNIFEKESNSHIYSGSNFNVRKSKSTFKVKSSSQNVNSVPYDETGSDPFTLYLVERFAPISLFVNEELDLLYINGDADRLLNMPKALARLNLRKMLGQEEFIAMKTGVKKVLETEEPVVYRNVLLRKDAERQYNARLRFSIPDLFHRGDEFQDQRFILIEIHLRDDRGDGKQEEDTETTDSDYKQEKEATLQKELRDAKRRSKDLVNELESTNEELQTSNRELMASNEELQSTNEELQSVNEELYTVNSELQLKNEELTTAHNDINNLLKSTEIGTIFLDKSLRIRKFTPAVRRQFELLNSDMGRTITSFSSTFQKLDIEQECQKVFDTLEGFEKEVIDKNEDHYLMRILPYRTEKDNIDGIVLTFININELVLTRRRMEKLAKKYKAIFNYSYSIIAVLDQEGKVESMNRPLGPYEPKSIIGSTLFEKMPEHINYELRAAFKKALEEETPSKIRLQLGQNNWFDISFIPNPYPENQEENSSIILMGEEVSEHQRRVTSLERSVEEYKGYMDNAPQQIALVNKEGVFHYVNYTHFTGLDREAIVGKKIFEFLQEQDRETMKKVLRGIFEESKPLVQYEAGIKGKDGQVIPSKLLGTPVIIDGKVEFAAIVQEIKEQNGEST